jgi:hypothetical protein
MKRWTRFMLVSALALAAPVRAEVQAVEREGFTIVLVADVTASPDRAYAAFSRPADWWDSEHSWSGDARNFRFEPRAGGCWCEALAGGGSVEHGRIIAYNPARRVIVMDSVLGPLLETAQAGRLIWRVEPGAREGTSRINWLYRVSIVPTGNPEQDAALAAAVDGVLAEQMARLAALLGPAHAAAQPGG